MADGVVERAEQHVLVISEQADPLVGEGRRVDHPIDDLARLRAAVDIVAEKDLDRALRAWSGQRSRRISDVSSCSRSKRPWMSPMA